MTAHIQWAYFDFIKFALFIFDFISWAGVNVSIYGIGRITGIIIMSSAFKLFSLFTVYLCCSLRGTLSRTMSIFTMVPFTRNNSVGFRRSSHRSPHDRGPYHFPHVVSHHGVGPMRFNITNAHRFTRRIIPSPSSVSLATSPITLFLSFAALYETWFVPGSGLLKIKLGWGYVFILGNTTLPHNRLPMR